MRVNEKTTDAKKNTFYLSLKRTTIEFSPFDQDYPVPEIESIEINGQDVCDYFKQKSDTSIPEISRDYVPSDDNTNPQISNEYVPPVSNEYIPPVNNEYVPPVTNEYVPPVTNEYVPPVKNVIPQKTTDETRPRREQQIKTESRAPILSSDPGFKYLNDCLDKRASKTYTTFCKDYNIPSTAFLIEKFNLQNQDYWCFNFPPFENHNLKRRHALMMSFNGSSICPISWVNKCFKNYILNIQ